MPCITEISFNLLSPFGGMGKPGKGGGKGKTSLCGNGNISFPSFEAWFGGKGGIGGMVSMDIRLPRRDGALFHMCVPMCTFKLPRVVNALPQTLHLNGLSPVWVRMWI